ncbi:hypothetical protein OROGR_000216 [Orobanche gracilis]
MIGWKDIYKVVASVVPLYVPLGLGYASVSRWQMFKPDHCDAINRFNCYYIIPFFAFRFTSSVDPYRMNYRFLAGDVVAKAIAGAVLALWANLWRRGNFSWAITSFSLSSLNNTLVVGVPLLQAMYGAVGEDIVVQSFVIQSLLWFPILIFMLEIRRSSIKGDHQSQQQQCSIKMTAVTTDNDANVNNIEHEENQDNAGTIRISSSSPQHGTGSTMMKVWAKLAKNPNCYASALGLIWALISKRWSIEMPSIVEGSVLIMANAGSGVAMFAMGSGGVVEPPDSELGLFMALQKKVIACGMRLSLYGMLLRFVGGPITTTIGSLALGLRSNTLRIAIIQAALPESLAAFVFAQEYGLHAEVLGTAVIFGTIVSLPLLIAYYAILDVI